MSMLSMKMPAMTMPKTIAARIPKMSAGASLWSQFAPKSLQFMSPEYRKQQTAHQAIMNWRSTLTPEQAELLKNNFKKYDKSFDEYTQDPSGNIEDVEKNGSYLQHLMTAQMTAMKTPEYQALLATHQAIMKWRSTLTPEQSERFKKMFKSYDTWFGWYTINPLDVDSVTYFKQESASLQNIMTAMQTPEYQELRTAHQAIMKWRSTLTPEQAEIFKDTFKSYDSAFGWCTRNPLDVDAIKYLKQESASLKNIIDFCDQSSFNPIKRYSDFLKWKKDQPEEVLQVVKSQMQELTTSMEAFIKNPDVVTARLFYAELNSLNLRLMEHYKPHRRVQFTSETEIKEFHDSFNRWKEQQSVQVQKALEPFTSRYEKLYKGDLDGSSLYEMQNIETFFYQLMHPEGSVNLIAIVQEIYDAHEKLMSFVSGVSMEHQKLIEPMIKEYLDFYNKYQDNPKLWTVFVINSQLEVVELLRKDLDMFKPIPGYNQTLPTNAKTAEDFERLEAFFNAATHSKSELVALQHFQDTQAPGVRYVPLCSLGRSIQALGSFSDRTQSIKVGQEFHEACPAVQYFTLLHEYRHYLQDLGNVLVGRNDAEFIARAKKFYPAHVQPEAKKHSQSMTWTTQDDTVWKPYEYDAESFAAEHVTCPVCLKISQCSASKAASPEGYFNQDNYEPFIRAAQHNACCPAHTQTLGDDAHNSVVQELQQLLEEYKKAPSFELRQKIVALDKQSGNLLQHIPEYNRDVVRRIAQRGEFQELLGARLLKELDVRTVMRKTEKDTHEGRYPLLTASSTSDSKLAPEQEPKTIIPEKPVWYGTVRREQALQHAKSAKAAEYKVKDVAVD